MIDGSRPDSKGHAQRPPGRQQVALAHHLVQRARAQAFGQWHALARRGGFFGKQRVLRGHGLHCGSAPRKPPQRPGHDQKSRRALALFGLLAADTAAQTRRSRPCPLTT
jgi:hypothetical protein